MQKSECLSISIIIDVTHIYIMFKLLCIDDFANAAYCDLSNDNNSIDVNDNADDDH